MAWEAAHAQFDPNLFNAVDRGEFFGDRADTVRADHTGNVDGGTGPGSTKLRAVPVVVGAVGGAVSVLSG